MVSTAHFLNAYIGLNFVVVALRHDCPAPRFRPFRRSRAQIFQLGVRWLGPVASTAFDGVRRDGFALESPPLFWRRLVARILTQRTAVETGLVFIVVAVAFKLGAVPFHMWVPDVYHGAPTSVAVCRYGAENCR